MHFPSSPNESARPGTSPQPADPAREPAKPDALTSTVLEIERHVATAGWDGPVRLFALIRTAPALAADPQLAHHLHPEVVAAAQADPSHILPVEQEDLPQAASVEELIGSVQFGQQVDGVAITLERIVVPPEAERDLPLDPDAMLEALMEHPQRQDVRMAVAVMRDGTNCCAVRSRAHDEDTAVGVGPDLAPGVIEGLRATLA